MRHIKLLLPCMMLLAGASALQSGAGIARAEERCEGRKVDEKAGREVREAQGEKESRTPAQQKPAQQKIDSQLLYALKQKRGEKRGVPTEPIKLNRDAKGRVLVDITARTSPRLLSKIRKLGGVVVSQSETYHTVRARLSLEKLEALAGLEEVRFIMPAAEAMNSGPMTN
jgi:hypothetical protein